MTVSEYSKIAVNHSYRGKGFTGISRQAALYRLKNIKRYPEIKKVEKITDHLYLISVNLSLL